MMHRLPVRLFVACLLIVSGLVLPARTQSSQSGGINGIVTDRQSGKPLVGVSVRIDGTRSGAVTGADGRFRIPTAPNGTIRIAATMVGYASETIVTTVTQGTTRDVVMTMLPSERRAADVVVSANKRVQAVQDVPISVAVLTADDMATRSITRLDDALKYVSGINVARDQVSIRGASGFALGVGSRTAVLIDGFPLLSGDNGDIKFDVLPVADVERVEIIKGAGSALYGTGALGGVVSMLTKEPTDQLDVSARLYGGAYTLPRYDQWRYRETLPSQAGVDLRLAQAFGPVRVNLSGSFRTDESYRDFDESYRGLFFGKIGWQLRERSTLKLFGLYAGEDRENYIFWRSLTYATRTTEDQNPDQRLYSGKAAFGLEWQELIGDGTALVVRPSLYRTRYENHTLGVVDDSNSSTAMAWSVEAQLTSLLRPDLVITAGIHGRLNDVTSDVYGTQVQTLLSAYGQGEWTPARAVTVTAGARVDREETASLASNIVVSPKIGLTWHLTKDTTALRASVGRGFRAPTIAERYARIQYAGIRVIENEAIAPEYSISAEIGINHRASLLGVPIDIDWSVFDNELESMIEPGFTNTGNIQFRNVTRARILGTELTLRGQVLPTVGIETGLTLMDPTDLTSDSVLKYRHRIIWYSRASWSIADGLSLQGEYRYLDRVDRTDRLAVVPDDDARVAIHLVDARLLWTMRPLRWTLQVRNMFDYAYTEVMANLGPTRSVQLQVEYSLR